MGNSSSTAASTTEVQQINATIVELNNQIAAMKQSFKDVVSGATALPYVAPSQILKFPSAAQVGNEYATLAEVYNLKKIISGQNALNTTQERYISTAESTNYMQNQQIQNLKSTFLTTEANQMQQLQNLQNSLAKSDMTQAEQLQNLQNSLVRAENTLQYLKSSLTTVNNIDAQHSIAIATSESEINNIKTGISSITGRLTVPSGPPQSINDINQYATAAGCSSLDTGYSNLTYPSPLFNYVYSSVGGTPSEFTRKLRLSCNSGVLTSPQLPSGAPKNLSEMLTYASYAGCSAIDPAYMNSSYSYANLVTLYKNNGNTPTQFVSYLKNRFGKGTISAL